MRLGILIASAVLVLVTLVSAFPQTFSTQNDRDNTADHMAFTRELADHSAKLDTLAKQHEAMAGLPERMVRIEERLDLMGRMIFAALAGIFALIGKEVWAGMRALRSRTRT